jgi:hypothetical protein
MCQVGAEALLPPRDISVSQWADENVDLTGSGSAERGQWHTRPYQREPMDVLSPSHPCKRVVLMSAAQMLKTSVMVNFLGYIADVDPGPTLAVEPRSEDAKALSKDRVAPLFRHSPALRGKLAAVKSRDSNNTAMHKVFANGSRSTQRFDLSRLANSIRSTFERRRTPLPEVPPIALTDEFLLDRAKQTQWNAFRRKLGLQHRPSSMWLDRCSSVF